MSGNAPKKDGHIRQKEYQADAFCKGLQPLVNKLNEDIGDTRHDAKGLGATVGQMLQFQEDALGANSLPPREFPKLPLQLFEDARPLPAAGLYLIAARLAAIRRATPGFKGFEWSNPGSRRFNLENLAIIRADLIRAGLLKVPVVAAHPSCGVDGQKALEAAKNLKANVVEDPADPSVTHVLYPNGALCVDENDLGGQMRTLQTSTQRARVHWRFLPDSYAEWVPLRAAPSGAPSERAAPASGPWRVTLRWAVDSEKYNEWMNPQDYEADEQKAKQVAAAEATAALGVPGAAGAAAAAAAAVGSKRPLGVAAQLAAAQAAALVGAKRVRADTEVDAADPGVEVAPGVLKRRVINPHKPAVDGSAAAENISQGQLDPTAPVPMLQPVPIDQQQQQQGGGGGGDTAMADAGDDGGGDGSAVRACRYMLPMHASWFSFSQVHNNEKRALPEYCAGVAAPGFSVKSYMGVRNALVTLYRRQPQRRLAVEEACEALQDHDPGVVARVHRFLDSWGIINWLAPRAAPTPAAAGLPAGTRLAPTAAPGAERPRLPHGAALAGSAAARAQAAGGLLQLRFPTIAEGVAAACAGGTLTMTAREARGNRLESSTSLAAGRRRYTCSAMPWVDCTPLRYHCTKLPGVDLCPQAYAEGRFPPGCASADFARLEGGADYNAPDAAGAAGKWTPQETLLLLEGLDMHGDQWPAVAEHVGTHSVLECITHFLQLPIEDDVLDELERRAAEAPGDAAEGADAGGGAKAAAAAQQEQQQLDEGIGRVPLAGSEGAPGNPLASTSALMSVVLAPRIASDAVRAGLEALASDDPFATARAIEARRLGADAAAAGGGDDQHAPPDPARPVTAAQTRAAAVVGLAAAAERAKLMAEQQERDMEDAARRMLRAQVKRMEIKARYLESIDQVLESETLKQVELLRRAEADRAADPRKKR
ncbi:MAG: hypothetical protein J3K34DRAFT_102566 [Monoraphidium minutum]|nr:MAG: hypothetical protein J3K34DRAFT_102566 [Monoraphidium minutum]